ncbi:glycosyl hydrolase family 8 [Fodinicurvata sp. EGI_FJ10296]|uniref:glycosyl hydrolase family 8 n=1 Tax=Fodinicurvata sp. EGI_FJ10296 TaxID=3231908 RepID=UPI00345530AB
MIASTLFRIAVMAVCVAFVMQDRGADAQEFESDDRDWQLYTDSFVEDGRVIDTGNDDISHSEGQGYGMVLAVAFNDLETFGSIWSWTSHRIWVRDDRSIAWRWEEDERPPITDANPAPDGDILVAWALIRAHQTWGIDEHAEAARAILDGIKENLIRRVGTVPVISAGISGFDVEGGFIVNPSYWIFPALTDIRRFDNDPLWDAVHETGRRLVRNARFGRLNLVPDWVVIDSSNGRLTTLPDDMDDLFRGFGYNAVRVPLYLLWDEPSAGDDIQPIADLWDHQGDGPVAIEVDLGSDRLLHRSDGQGYRAVRALVNCVVADEAMPSGLQSLNEGQDYYSASLYLLTRVAMAERDLAC